MNNFESFTNQFALSKTLRFELKPVAETAQWIKEHHIIGREAGKTIGKDAERAAHYKQLKKLLDTMHRLFLQQSLFISPESYEYQELSLILTAMEANYLDSQPLFSGNYLSNVDNKNIKLDKGLSQWMSRQFNKTLNDWAYQYIEDMPTYLQQDIEQLQNKLANESNPKQVKRFQNALHKVQNKHNKEVVFKGKDYKSIYSNTHSLQLLEWLVRKEKINVTDVDLGIGDEHCPLSVDQLLKIVRSFDGFSTYLSGFNENRANVYELKNIKATSVLSRTFEQNFTFHLENITKWQTVFEKHQYS